MCTSCATVCPSSTMIFFVQWVSLVWNETKSWLVSRIFSSPFTLPRPKKNVCSQFSYIKWRTPQSAQGFFRQTNISKMCPSSACKSQFTETFKYAKQDLQTTERKKCWRIVLTLRVRILWLTLTPKTLEWTLTETQLCRFQTYSTLFTTLTIAFKQSNLLWIRYFSRNLHFRLPSWLASLVSGYPVPAWRLHEPRLRALWASCGKPRRTRVVTESAMLVHFTNI